MSFRAPQRGARNLYAKEIPRRALRQDQGAARNDRVGRYSQKVLHIGYKSLPDANAAQHQLIRVIDESGEDYLYPADYFVPIKLPQLIVKALALPA